MWTFTVIALVTLVAGPTLNYAQIDCTNSPDGSYGTGCQSYTKCEGGRGSIVNCNLPNLAYDWRTGQCEPVVTVPPPCGSIDNNCTGYPDRRYPILSFNCTYFYTCINGVFFGANPCNNPENGTLLRFDIDQQVCNWFYDVHPPCGTFIEPTEPPKVEKSKKNRLPSLNKPWRQS